MGAGVARTTGLDRVRIGPKLGPLDIQRPRRGEQAAVTAVAGRQDTVEHIDAEADQFHEFLRPTHAHQVPRRSLRQLGSDGGHGHSSYSSSGGSGGGTYGDSDLANGLEGGDGGGSGGTSVLLRDYKSGSYSYKYIGAAHGYTGVHAQRMGFSGLGQVQLQPGQWYYDPVAGVWVGVLGTNLGVATDSVGEFRIEYSDGIDAGMVAWQRKDSNDPNTIFTLSAWPEALRFTFTIYESKEIIKGGREFTHIVHLK